MYPISEYRAVDKLKVEMLTEENLKKPLYIR